MSAGYQNLLIEQGASFSTTITLDDTNGATYNLANFTGESQIRSSYYTANLAGQFSITIPQPNTGQIYISMTASNTANIFPGRYVYDVKLVSNTDPDNNTIRILEGIVEISPQVSR
jgi:hypothetical protein